MIWSSIDNDERLRLWKNLRNEISNQEIEYQLEKISKFCSTMPIGSRSIDYYSTENWPTPWEILYHGSFCTSSISLLIFYTLTLTMPDAQIRLELIEDSYGIYLIPVIEDRFVLNYELGKISILSEIKGSITTINVFEKHQIKNLT
jgi:hypothetical protein